MGNSTRKLQDVVDFISTMGDLSPYMPAAGFSTLLATNIANSVVNDLLSQRFNWKFNRIQVPAFYTNSLQQDNAAANSNIGWLENACIVDINNTSLPKPIFWIEAVRDLQRTSFQFGRPAKICWLPNDQMTQDVWPGAAKTYTNPVGAVTTPSNPPTNIRDAHNNILLLTTFGVTGSSAPDAGANALVGATVNDGTCVWTVLDPKAQGFRISPLPPQAGLVYQVLPVAQARPPRFTSLQQTLDPIPDDYSQYFDAGFIAYAHRHATAPEVKKRFDAERSKWLQAMADACRQGDRERDDAGFVPDHGVMQSEGCIQPRADYPFAL